jgi:uncharacterized protein YbcI
MTGPAGKPPEDREARDFRFEPLRDPHLARLAQDAAEEVHRIHHATHGVGAAKARGDFFGESTLIVFLDGIELLANEEFLISQGDAETVMHSRTRFQEAVGERFIAAVERAIGRRVETFNSVTNLEGSRFAAEIFTLEPGEGESA